MIGQVIQATMSLSPGTRLGHYAVTALIGEGGMGQVWQATDTQLGRQVALKILHDAFAADPDRLARETTLDRDVALKVRGGRSDVPHPDCMRVRPRISSRFGASYSCRARPLQGARREHTGSIRPL